MKMNAKDCHNFVLYVNLARRYWRDSDAENLDRTLSIMDKEFPDYSREQIRDMVYLQREPERLRL